ncbi:FAD binding domain-containing protein [Radiomyces spectabilis]|uniref:FAD binding domain-containing protein n=1 Tax=Radiomyces spectabilis TaxID=64574 RepID=UPI00221FF291|nr:FAD binding domain-containing protein [Radiomyces spectabilis]KAI8393997.1 FAD binding domain-containing protein [Radiomyces spectabilis]
MTQSETIPVVDALIVGGGPVGLLAANLLVKSGFKDSLKDHNVFPLDIEFEPQHWGRGDWVHGRTLELLDHVGLGSELLKTGAKVEEFAFHHGKQREYEPVVQDTVISKYRHLLCVGQHITENHLQHTLSEHDVQVERPVTVKEFAWSEDEQLIRATLQNVSSGEQSTVMTKYLLGCDGAHSDIRRQLGIQSNGQGSCLHSGVLDALVRSNFPDKQTVSYVHGPMGNVCLFPRENNLLRVMVHMSSGKERNQIQLNDIQTEARRALLPYRVEFLAVLWWTVYSVGQHVAQEMQRTITPQDNRPRVFLCGDAAHSQSPTLGQGLNTGLGDVFNLVWKLVMVESGKLQPSILSTYESERRSVAQQVIDIDAVVAKEAHGGSSLAEDKSDLQTLFQQHRHFSTGFGISYRSTATNVLPVDGNKRALQAGDRMPDFKIVCHSSGKKVRLYDLWRAEMDQYQWQFHMVVLSNDIAHTFPLIREFLHKYKQYSSWMSVHLMTTTVQGDIIDQVVSKTDPPVLVDKINNAQCHQSFDAFTHCQVVVVRPDLYIGWTGALGQRSELDQWLGGIMVL